MNKALRKHQRGTLMLGMAGLIAVLAMLCAAVTAQSLQVFVTTAQGAHRLEVQAAAEGAAVLVAQDPEDIPDTATIGRCSVKYERAFRNFRDTTVRFTVTLAPHDGEAVRSATYAARYSLDDADQWQLRFLREEPE